MSPKRPERWTIQFQGSVDLQEWLDLGAWCGRTVSEDADAGYPIVTLEENTDLP